MSLPGPDEVAAVPLPVTAPPGPALKIKPCVPLILSDAACELLPRKMTPALALVLVIFGVVLSAVANVIG